LSISLYTYVYYLAALVACGLGFWKGDAPLRITSVVTIISWSITPLLGHWDGEALNVPQTLVDAVTTVSYILISLRFRRLWTVVLSALALLVVLCPFVDLADARVHRNSWIAANNILAVCQIAVLCVVLWLTIRARRRADEGALRP
jgi:hypothetical protein